MDKKVRNLQEQVCYLTEQMELLQAGIKVEFFCTDLIELSAITIEENVGKYAVVNVDLVKHLYLITKRINGDPIATDLGIYPNVITGPTGLTGEKGDNGERGNKIVVGYGPLPNADDFIENDVFILKQSFSGANKKGDVFQIENGEWKLRLNITGAQGPIGETGESVIPNPEGDADSTADSLDINGLKYALKDFRLSDATWDQLDAILERVDVNSGSNSITINTSGGVKIPLGGLEVNTGGITVYNGETSLKETKTTNLTFSTYIKALNSIGRFNIGSLSKIQDLDNNPLIVPNKEGTPTETLNQIELGGTLYSLPSGGGGSDVYEHRFQYASGHTFIFFNLYNNSQSNLGLEGIKTSLGLQGIICNGTFAKSGEQKHVVYIQASSSTGIWSVYYIDNGNGINSASVGVSQANLTETVIKIS